jgi:hypothetical protein
MIRTIGILLGFPSPAAYLSYFTLSTRLTSWILFRSIFFSYYTYFLYFLPQTYALNFCSAENISWGLIPCDTVDGVVSLGVPMEKKGVQHRVSELEPFLFERTKWAWQLVIHTYVWSGSIRSGISQVIISDCQNLAITRVFLVRTNYYFKLMRWKVKLICVCSICVRSMLYWRAPAVCAKLNGTIRFSL